MHFNYIFRENRKKEIGFSELIRLLHRKLPLNIISQHVDINTLDSRQMTQILRNTLTETGIYIKRLLAWQSICLKWHHMLYHLKW